MKQQALILHKKTDTQTGCVTCLEPHNKVVTGLRFGQRVLDFQARVHPLSPPRRHLWSVKEVVVFECCSKGEKAGRSKAEGYYRLVVPVSHPPFNRLKNT